MSTRASRRSSLKEDRGAASATYWQCRRQSHPVQRMGGVCAMCLTEQLSSITRSSSARRPQSTDLLPQSFGRPAHLTGTYAQSMDSKGNNTAKEARMCARQCEHDDDGIQLEISARNSSVSSEQSIASLVERDIDEGRQRYSDVTAGWSKEVARTGSSNDGHVSCTKQQLARSRSSSTSSHASSKQSTPASHGKSNSAVLPKCGDEYKFRRCVTVRAEIRSSNGAAPLLAKSKSTGSSYNGHAKKLPGMCSPAAIHHHHVWSLPKLWHKKFAQTERRHSSAEASSARRDLSSPPATQAEDSVPLMKMSRSRSMSAGARENFKSICDQIRCMGITKWLTSSSFHILRHSPQGKPSDTGPGAGPNTRTVRTGSHACKTEPLIHSNGRGDEGAAAIGTTRTSGVEYAPALSCATMLRMQPTHQEDCQSIAALVSMDAHLIHHLV